MQPFHTIDSGKMAFVFFLGGAWRHYEIFGPQEIENRKFNMKASEYFVRWKNMEQSPDLEETVLSALEEILERLYSEGAPTDMVNVRIDHESLDNPIYIGYSQRQKLTAQKILLMIKKVQQSKKMLRFDSDLRITFSRIRLPEGGARQHK